MHYRTTSQTSANQAIRYVANFNSKIVNYQNQISSGLRLHRSSDDPVAFRQVTSLSTQLQQLQAESYAIVDVTMSLGRNMLKNFDILTDEMPTGSLAVVAVSADIPPFVRPGEMVPATVSVFDDATGLYGGVLQSTVLKAFDGQVYATAGGPLVLSGFSASGEGGSVSKNHDTTGKVQARIQVGMQQQPAFPSRSICLLLTNKDYATAHRIAEQINTMFPGHARARDQGCVDVVFPVQYAHSKFEFVVT